MSTSGEIEWKLLSDLIETRFGMTFVGVRREILESRLRPRLKELHLETFLEYYHYLRSHPGREAELAELARRITNNETYFYREPHHFDILVQHILPQLSAELKHRPIRILSAGCSSGEEPYSMVIALQNAGLELRGYRWEIDACDLNPVRLAQAREAVYEATSLRVCNEDVRQRYFLQANGRFLLKERHRTGVRFLEANLATTDPRPEWGPYDAILCRNLLIYFSEPAFYALVARFARVLRLGGYLMLGHSESLIDKVREFEPVCLSGAVVYRRVTAA